MILIGSATGHQLPIWKAYKGYRRKRGDGKLSGTCLIDLSLDLETMLFSARPCSIQGQSYPLEASSCGAPHKVPRTTSV